MLPATHMPPLSAMQQVRKHHIASVEPSTVILSCQLALTLFCTDSMCQLLPLLLSAMQQVNTHRSASVCSSTAMPICQLERTTCTLHKQHASAVTTNAHAFKCNAASQDSSQRFCVIQNCNLHLSAGTHHLQLAQTARISCYHKCSCL